MSINSKKLVSAALTATTLLWAVGATALPLAQAQSTSSLQAQIAALLAQIQQLQSQLNTSGSTTTSVTYDFTSDLTVGSTGTQVSQLQQMLISKGYLTAVSAPTGYFGALTQSALAKFQAANGITPSVGYFGPKTRAFVNAMTSTSTTTTTTTTTTGTGTTTTAPASGLFVSLASTNPSAGSLITSAPNTSGNGAARVPVLAVSFTAGNSGAVTVSAINFHKTGVLADSSIAGAYLVQNGQVIAQYNSINNGVISFSGLNWQIAAGQTETVDLAIDVAGGLSAGNTTGFSLNTATDVTAWDVNSNAITPTGAFPLNGNTFTVTSVSNPSLATVQIASSSIGTQVTAGTQGNLVGAYTFNVGNSKVWLEGINFHVIGSANKTDLQNVKLVVNGTQVGATLASVSATGLAYFNLSATPAVLNTGSNNVQLFADVMGSPSYNFQFEILNSFDVLAVDSQYNVPVTVTNTGGTASNEQVSIQQGQTTVTQDSSTPTGSIAKNQSQVTLAKFDVYASGEAIKLKYITFELTFTGATSSAVSSQVKNVSLVDDAGGQVGSTINTPPTGNTCDTGSLIAPSQYPASEVYTDCFGTSGSPINYVIPANTTRVLSLKADIQSTATFSTVTGSLTGNTGNLQGLTSSQIGNTGGSNGSALTLANSSLTVSANNALGNQNVSAGVTNQEIGSYALTAASAEGVNVNNLSVMASGSYFQNLKVFVNGTQFGTTQGTVNGGTIYTFSGTPFNVPAGGTTDINVFADTLSSATGTVTNATTLTGLSATGAVSYSSVSLPASVPGQNLSFSGSATIVVSSDSTQPASTQLTMGSTGNTLAVYRFTETSNVENVKVTDLTVNASTTGKAAFSNLTLYNGSTVLGTAGSASSVSGGYVYTFHFATPILVPQANSVSVTLKGDLASYASNGATDNATTSFYIASPASVIALGATSNKPTTVASVSGASGNTMTVLRSTLTAFTSPLGATSNRAKSATDDFGTVTFSANSAGPVALDKLTITLSGATATTTLMSTSNILLIDQNGNNVVAAGEATSTVTTSTNGGTVTWYFPTSAATSTGFQISGGGSYTFKLRLNTAAVAGTANVSQSLSATIQNPTDVQYTDGLDASSTSGLALPTSVVPLTINSVSYAQGS